MCQGVRVSVGVSRCASVSVSGVRVSVGVGVSRCTSECGCVKMCE